MCSHFLNFSFLCLNTLLASLKMELCPPESSKVCEVYDFGVSGLCNPFM